MLNYEYAELKYNGGVSFINDSGEEVYSGNLGGILKKLDIETVEQRKNITLMYIINMICSKSDLELYKVHFDESRTEVKYLLRKRKTN